MNTWNPKPHEARNIIRKLSQMGRDKEEIVSIDLADIIEGERVQKTTRFRIEGDTIITQEIIHKSLMPCGHIGNVGDIVFVADCCGRLTCSICIFPCSNCGLRLCPHCRHLDEQGQILCGRCYAIQKRKEAARRTCSVLKQFFTQEA